MITGIDHIEIIVRDLDQFVAFYEKLGFKVVRWTDHHGKSVEMQVPGENQPIFEIHQLIGEENPGINHISFRVENIDATHADLKAKGVAFQRGVHQSSTGRKNALLRDPDGWRLQLSDMKRGKAEGER